MSKTREKQVDMENIKKTRKFTPFKNVFEYVQY